MSEVERKPFDWRMAGATFLMVAAQGFIQWGVVTTQIAELNRRVERIELKIDDKMMPREEFEMRFQDLQKRVEDLREEVQQLQVEHIHK